MEALEPVDAGGEELLVAALRWPEYVDGVSNLAHKIVDLTDARALVVLVEMDGRVFAVVRSRSERLDASRAGRDARRRRSRGRRIGDHAARARGGAARRSWELSPAPSSSRAVPAT